MSMTEYCHYATVDSQMYGHCITPQPHITLVGTCMYRSAIATTSLLVLYIIYCVSLSQAFPKLQCRLNMKNSCRET